MSAGRFDKRLEIQTATQSVDAIGGVALAWATTAKRWGRIEDLAGSEFFDADHVRANLTARITLREIYPGLTPKHRVKYGTRIFNIGNVINAGERNPRAGQELMCTETTDE